MGVALVADSHLGGAGGAADELVEQLRELPSRGCERLVLLGDIFHVWVGDRRFETDSIRRVLKCLRELRAGGLAIDYIEGNRDFFLPGSPYAEVFDSIGTELTLEHRGRRHLLVHGDGIDAADRQYLFWRWLSKSALSRALVTRLPASLARRGLERTEARLAKTNFKHRLRIPEEAIRGFAERRLAEGYSELVLGHYHEPIEWQVEGGRVRVLDAWFNSRRLEWL